MIISNIMIEGRNFENDFLNSNFVYFYWIDLAKIW